MRKRKHNRTDLPKIQKDTLIVIGNGFDIWQGLHTSYAQFQAYYLAHRDAILKKLHKKGYTVFDEDGTSFEITDVEIVYGDPFDPSDLDDTFWGTFETSLADVDAERINLFFGKEKSDLRDLKRSVKNASRILREACCGWIASMVIEPRTSPYDFGENCLFINFNYTDTLLKRFQISPEDEFHIHGEASDKDSIIVGHSNHPQQPVAEMLRLGGRFRGLYLIEELLYETDKHVHENIGMLSMFLATHGVNPPDIKDVYVLGHSMSPPDIEYFIFLMSATQIHTSTQPETDLEELDDLDPMEEFHARISYAVDRYGYQHGEKQVDLRQEQIVMRRLELEQNTQREWMEKQFFRAMGMGRHWHRLKGDMLPVQEPRTEDAMWHLSYYGETDKTWKEAVLKELGCKRYELLPTIDACLEKFSVSRNQEA